MTPDNIIKERAIGYVDLLEAKFSKKSAETETQCVRIRAKIQNADLLHHPKLEAIQLFIDWIMPLPGAHEETLRILLNT